MAATDPTGNDEIRKELVKIRQELSAEMSEKIDAHPSLTGLTSEQRNGVYKIIGTLLLGAVALLSLAGYFIVDNASREGAANIAASDVADKLQARDDFIDDLGERTIALSSGAVIAYKLPSGCPEGWVEYAPARGRAIIGVSTGNADESENRKFQEQGGSALHQLRLEELPLHSHEYEGIEVIGEVSPGEGLPAVEVYSKTTEYPSDGGKAHNNMPPYVALYYCEKQ